MNVNECVYDFEVFDFCTSILVLKGLDDGRACDFDQGIYPMLVSVRVSKFEVYCLPIKHVRFIVRERHKASQYGKEREKIDEVTNISNAIFSEPQINRDDVKDSSLASWGNRWSNGAEGHFRCAAIVGYENSSDKDTTAQTLTKHVRGRAVNPAELVNQFRPGVSHVSWSLLLASKGASSAQKEAKVGS